MNQASILAESFLHTAEILSTRGKAGKGTVKIIHAGSWDRTGGI